MLWIQQNWQVAACIAAAVLWLIQNFGKSAVQKARNVFASLKPKIEGKTTIMNAWPLLVMAILLGPKLLPTPGPVTPVVPIRQPDIVDQCGASGRALLADELEKFSGEKFDSDKAKEDAINDKISDVIEASFEPLNKQIADAIKANRVTDLADKIRKGELR